MTSASEKPVVCKTLKTRSGHKLGILTLNAPAAMNAVDLTMVNLIDRQLKRWEDDDDVVAIFMHGAGDKAFSAGGDIRKLYDSMCADGDEQYRYADAFFSGEYGKNYRVHLVTKPLVAWGNGFVMGGGLGLFIGANHRIGTETLKLAWPEVRIGLFPDVAASWYLSHLPYPAGHWMALTGSHMNAVDCRALTLTQYAMAHSQQADVIKVLKTLSWTANAAENHHKVRDALHALEDECPLSLPASRMDDARADIQALLADRSLSAIARRFEAYAGNNDWVKQGIANFRAGCPATAQLIMVQLERGALMSLKEVVQWELILAYQAVRHPDFAEGIRAMVVDKDFAPRWAHSHVDAVPKSWVDGLMHSPWSRDEHPLADL
ncbi:enoyl-CoA hydratase/isomerase family protein [Thalassolituus sp. LLYu03]|uniref:enoyl-CoA hydratase/isomerase family protein n=1 Tax=Thalassolituus sp. LLYu03 TaxID=3421656 RepID=UPI003D2CCFA9